VDKTSLSLTQLKSEFEKWIRADRPAIEKAALGFLSCAKLSLNARNGQSVTAGFMSSDWGSLCVATIALGFFSCAKLSLDARHGQSVTLDLRLQIGAVCTSRLSLWGSFPAQNCLWMQGMARV